jgi:hypothetical protein
VHRKSSKNFPGPFLLILKILLFALESMVRVLRFAMLGVLCVFIGCSSGTSPAPPDPPTPPAPPAPVLSVVSPANGSTVSGDSVTISVSAQNVSDPTQVSVLVNGVDSTAKLGKTDTNGVRSLQLGKPDVNYGKNQVQVRYQDVRANSVFNLASFTVTAPSSSNTPDYSSALLVPIQTRVINSNVTNSWGKSWGIQVGDTSTGTFYPAAQPVDQNNQNCTQGCDGYQILLLNRQTLAKRIEHFVRSRQ